MEIKNNPNIERKNHADKKWGGTIIPNKKIRQSISWTVTMNNIKMLLRQSVIEENKSWVIKNIGDQSSWIVK